MSKRKDGRENQNELENLEQSIGEELTDADLEQVEGGWGATGVYVYAVDFKDRYGDRLRAAGGTAWALDAD